MQSQITFAVPKNAVSLPIGDNPLDAGMLYMIWLSALDDANKWERPQTVITYDYDGDGPEFTFVPSNAINKRTNCPAGMPKWTPLFSVLPTKWYDYTINLSNAALPIPEPAYRTVFQLRVNEAAKESEKTGRPQTIFARYYTRDDWTEYRIADANTSETRYWSPVLTVLPRYWQGDYIAPVCSDCGAPEGDNHYDDCTSLRD